MKAGRLKICIITVQEVCISLHAMYIRQSKICTKPQRLPSQG